MQSYLLFLATFGLNFFADALPTANGTCNTAGENLPVFEGKRPQTANITWMENRLGPGFDPPNCGISTIHETVAVGDGSPSKWTFWKQVSVSFSVPFWCVLS